MATRSFITVKGNEGFTDAAGNKITQNHEVFGRYCHWDGYPEHMKVQLEAIIEKFGVQKAKTRLLATDWSSIELNGNEIGTINPNPTAPEYINETCDWGVDFIYIIHDSGLVTYVEI